MIFFTSDTHFGHANILEYSHRPFATVEAMDEALIANWNTVVHPSHEVWHLGDFVCGRAGKANARRYRERLNGRIHLILGNHDNAKALDGLFETIQDVKYLRTNGHRFFLSHYAHRVWRNSHHGSYHLYGHSHGELPGRRRSMDVGVDAQRYFPIAMEDVLSILEDEPPTINHHDTPSRQGDWVVITAADVLHNDHEADGA